MKPSFRTGLLASALLMACGFAAAGQPGAVDSPAGHSPIRVAPAAAATARPAAMAGATPMEATPKPILVIAHTKVTKVEASSTKIYPGQPLTVKVYGTGLESQCATTIFVEKTGGGAPYLQKGQTLYASGGWPRANTFMLPNGNYRISLSMTDGGPGTSQAEREACGITYANNNSGIPGDGTLVLVGDIPS